LGAFPGQFRRVFLVSAIPAVLSILVLALFVRAPRRPVVRLQALHVEARALGGAFHRFLLVAGIFSLASSSTAFLLLRAHQAGFNDRQLPLVYMLYNLIYAGFSWPAGEISDRIGRRPLLCGAYALFAALYFLMAWRADRLTVLAAFALLGIHSALLEGSQRALIADLVDAERRATAYGLYYAVVGLALLPASVITGAIWDRFGAPMSLAVDALAALVATGLFAWLLPWAKQDRAPIGSA